MSEKELHTHGTDCACGHNHHHHDDGCGCGCGHDHAHEDIDKKAFLRKLVPGLFFFLLGAAVEHLIPGSESSALWHYVELAAFALSYIFVGFSILREAVEGVLAKNIFNENLLMAVASLGAFAIGEYSEGCADHRPAHPAAHHLPGRRGCKNRAGSARPSGRGSPGQPGSVY